MPLSEDLCILCGASEGQYLKKIVLCGLPFFCLFFTLGNAPKIGPANNPFWVSPAKGLLGAEDEHCWEDYIISFPACLTDAYMYMF